MPNLHPWINQNEATNKFENLSLLLEYSREIICKLRNQLIIVRTITKTD